MKKNPILTTVMLLLANSGQRVQLDSRNGLQTIDADGNTRLQLPISGTELWIRPHDTGPGKIQFGDMGQIYASTSSLRMQQYLDAKYAEFATFVDGSNNGCSITASPGGGGANATVLVSCAPSLAIALNLDGAAVATFSKVTGVVKHGFFGSAAIAKPEITGTRQGNAGLASALTGLANLGLVTDSTTAGTTPGDVLGPGSATDNAIARFDGAGGKTLQNSGVTISDTGVIAATGLEVENITINSGPTIDGDADECTIQITEDADSFANLFLQANTGLGYCGAAITGQYSSSYYAEVAAVAVLNGSYARLIVNGDTVVEAARESGANKLGFFGAAAVAKPTVSGSRGANAALASLLTALANYGLITDSSS